MLTSKKPDEIDERVDAAAEEFKAKKSEAMIVQQDHGILFCFWFSSDDDALACELPGS